MTSIAKFFATGFGSGYFPVGPGTAGSVLASMVIYLTYTQTSLAMSSMAIILLIATIVSTLIGIWACGVLEQEWGEDPSKVVIDEMAGIFIAFIWVPFSIPNLLISLVLFRIFDIWKPLWIGKAEDMHGGVGVMADDLLAGIVANVILQVLVYFSLTSL